VDLHQSVWAKHPDLKFLSISALASSHPQRQPSSLFSLPWIHRLRSPPLPWDPAVAPAPPLPAYAPPPPPVKYRCFSSCLLSPCACKIWPRRPALTAPARPCPAIASIQVHAVCDGELCPCGGEGHIPTLLPLWPPDLFHEKISFQICRRGGGGGGAHLRAIVISGCAPQHRPNLAFSVEAWARGDGGQGRHTLPSRGPGVKDQWPDGWAAGEDRWAGGWRGQCGA
jgi:hypothetical protein